MIASSYEQQIRQAIADQLGIHRKDDSRFAVDLPLAFPDGDCCRVFVSRNEDGSWRVGDAGSSVMRASYEESVDVLSKGYRPRFQQIVTLHGLEESRGEIVRASTHELGASVFAIAQAALEIVNLAATPAEKKKKKPSEFRAKLSRIVLDSVGDLAKEDWHDPEQDPEGLYPVTFRIDASPTAIHIYGASGASSCVHSVMSGLFYKDFAGIRSVAVYANADAIPKRETVRLDKLVDKRFASLDDPAAIKQYLRAG